MTPTHPHIGLRDEIPIRLGLECEQLARLAGVPVQASDDVVKGKPGLLAKHRSDRENTSSKGLVASAWDVASPA